MSCTLADMMRFLLQGLELLGAHSLVAKQLLVAFRVEDAIALESRLQGDDGLHLLVADPDAHLLGLDAQNGLVDQIVQGLLLEVEALDELFRQVGAESLAVRVEEALVLFAIIVEGDARSPIVTSPRQDLASASIRSTGRKRR